MFSYQLTSHPIGSKREFWALTWPLMIGLLSSTLMFSIDRLFLAHLDPLALNAAVNGGMAYYMFLVIPLGIVEIAEVVVGRLHGEKRLQEIGTAVWQMVLFSVCLLPIFLLIAAITPSLLFQDTGNMAAETLYFQTLMPGAFIYCSVISLSGFFIGIGNVKIVTYSAIVSNIINIFLDYLLIFGTSWSPDLGIKGAAIATIIAQSLQFLFLLSIFWKKENRVKYRTHSLKIHFPFLLEGLRIGIPSGFGRSFEIVAHFIFFRIITSVGPEQMTILAVSQSIYILSSFIVDAQGKGASAIIANLLGANQLAAIPKVLKSGMILHTGYSLILFLIVYFFPTCIISLFNVEALPAFLNNPELLQICKRALIFVSFFFLFDGWTWIFIGFLSAAKDTQYIFWISLLVNWLAYIPFTFWFIGVNKGGADQAWAIIVFIAVLNVLFYWRRYSTGRWLKYSLPNAIL